VGPSGGVRHRDDGRVDYAWNAVAERDEWMMLRRYDLLPVMRLSETVK